MLRHRRAVGWSLFHQNSSASRQLPPARRIRCHSYVCPPPLCPGQCQGFPPVVFRRVFSRRHEMRMGGELLAPMGHCQRCEEQITLGLRDDDALDVYARAARSSRPGGARRSSPSRFATPRAAAGRTACSASAPAARIHPAHTELRALPAGAQTHRSHGGSAARDVHRAPCARLHELAAQLLLLANTDLTVDML